MPFGDVTDAGGHSAMGGAWREYRVTKDVQVCMYSPGRGCDLAFPGGPELGIRFHLLPFQKRIEFPMSASGDIFFPQSVALKWVGGALLEVAWWI